MQNASVHYWHSLGCPLDKLVLGLATYARTFLMSSAAQNQPGDSYRGAAGAVGPYSATAGFLAYYEVCELLDSGGWTRVWMNDSKVPYAYGLRDGQWTWMAYDDLNSMSAKVRRFAFFVWLINVWVRTFAVVWVFGVGARYAFGVKTI